MSQKKYTVLLVYTSQCFCCVTVSGFHSYGKVVFVLFLFYLIVTPHKNNFKSNHLLACY